MKQTKWTTANAVKATALLLPWLQLIIPPALRTNRSVQALAVWSQMRVLPTSRATATDSERLALLARNDDTAILGVSYITSGIPLFPEPRARQNLVGGVWYP